MNKSESRMVRWKAATADVQIRYSTTERLIYAAIAVALKALMPEEDFEELLKRVEDYKAGSQRLGKD